MKISRSSLSYSVGRSSASKGATSSTPASPATAAEPVEAVGSSSQVNISPMAQTQRLALQIHDADNAPRPEKVAEAQDTLDHWRPLDHGQRTKVAEDMVDDDAKISGS